MNWLSYFFYCKPPIFDLEGKESKDLSHHRFQPEEKSYLCRFSKYFRVEAQRICKLFDIKLSIFKHWKEDEEEVTTIDAIDLLKYNVSEIMAVPVVVVVNSTRDIGTQTDEPTVIERRKSWDQLDRKYQSSIANQTMEYIQACPHIRGFTKEDQQKLLSFTLSKIASPESLEASRTLNSLLATFRVALQDADERKNSDLRFLLLSLLHPTFTQQTQRSPQSPNHQISMDESSSSSD